MLLWPADPFLGGVPFWCKAPAALLAVLAPHADLLLHGRYMDTAGLSFDAARLRAHWHRAGGDVLLVAHNRTDAPVTARLELARTVLPAGTPPGTGVSLRDGRALVPVMREGTLQVEFPLPPGATDGVRCRFA